ncbi:Conserved_hypothetical protein [Hexamita inflata]|uniref:Uncharacterized protein n=1 Tax=Hexamita inflata TaxID=28002 RepID=A0AA86U2W5_9EUKA|nr:Conserved hypothetical protein [Hexamita inflata]CAI9940107.1 Conserved hypothetical protein [Hexamita inflata]
MFGAVSHDDYSQMIQDDDLLLVLKQDRLKYEILRAGPVVKYFAQQSVLSRMISVLFDQKNENYQTVCDIFMLDVAAISEAILGNAQVLDQIFSVLKLETDSKNSVLNC